MPLTAGTVVRSGPAVVVSVCPATVASSVAGPLVTVVIIAACGVGGTCPGPLRAAVATVPKLSNVTAHCAGYGSALVIDDLAPASSIAVSIPSSVVVSSFGTVSSVGGSALAAAA